MENRLLPSGTKRSQTSARSTFRGRSSRSTCQASTRTVTSVVAEGWNTETISLAFHPVESRSHAASASISATAAGSGLRATDGVAGGGPGGRAVALARCGTGAGGGDDGVSLHEQRQHDATRAATDSIANCPRPPNPLRMTPRLAALPASGQGIGDRGFPPASSLRSGLVASQGSTHVSRQAVFASAAVLILEPG